MNRLLTITTVLITAGILAACSKAEDKPEISRPVRTVTAVNGHANTFTFAGEVKPRHETRLAFRVSGQLLERRIEIGTVVAAGQVLARLDNKDLRLSETGARARLAQAESQALLAEADFKRFAGLRAKNFISQAEFERRESQFTQAREEAAAVQAAAEQSMNQTGYGTLIAPHAGVITAIEAESGQVVTSGQTIARLARLDETEIAFSVPEHLLDAVKNAERFEIGLWSKPDAIYPGRLRELSPIADAASRTYPARLSVQSRAADLAYGMSAEVRVSTAHAGIISVPLTALTRDREHASVWVAEGEPLTARRVPVTPGAIQGDSVQILAGLAAGQVVITAGANMLTEGQHVRAMDNVLVAGAKP
ncbi:MAG: efflux RND transporter periplasmic adaptor subunit [Gammaproteobacteria bacterium]|nr:efflux RND transporter periplasmic adaptor subunit [Gammaproteobacteria bacterium]